MGPLEPHERKSRIIVRALEKALTSAFREKFYLQDYIQIVHREDRVAVITEISAKLLYSAFSDQSIDSYDIETECVRIYNLASERLNMRNIAYVSVVLKPRFELNPPEMTAFVHFKQ